MLCSSFVSVLVAIISVKIQPHLFCVELYLKGKNSYFILRIITISLNEKSQYSERMQ